MAASSSIPPSKPAGTPEGGAGPYVIGIVVLLAAGGGLYWWKSQAPEAKTEPTAAASTPVKSVEPPKPQFAPPPPPPPEEEDAGVDAGDDAGPASSASAKVGVGGGTGKGPCQKCGEGKPSAALTSAIRSTAQGAQGCYNRALRQGEASGQMTVSVSVGSTGNVCGASIASDSVGSAEISSCVLGRFRGKTFPPPDEGCVVVNVPINFVAK